MATEGYNGHGLSVVTHGTAINWGPVASDSPLLSHPLYIKWSNKAITSITANPIDLRTDIGNAVYNNDTAEVVAYLANLLRTSTLLVG